VVNKLYKIKKVLKHISLESNRESSFDPRVECRSVITNGLPMMFTPHAVIRLTKVVVIGTLLRAFLKGH
jgi:hypothetical protein